MKRDQDRTGIAGVVLALAALAAGCGGDARAGDMAGAAETDTAPDRGYTRVVNVETSTVAARPFTETIRLTGTVAAYRDVVLSAEESGTVRELLAEKGTRVGEGSPIVRLDDRVLRAQLRESRARAELARETWERNRQLFEEEQAISQLAYLQTKYGSDEAEARRDALARRVERTTIRAPFAGVVESREVEIGSLVSPGTPVARLVELDTLRIQAGVPERYAPDVDVGDPVTVTFDVFGGDRFDGRLTFAGSVVNPRNRTFPVEVTLPNPGRRIKPEMVANLSLARRSLDDAVVVDAHRKSGGRFVGGRGERLAGLDAEDCPVPGAGDAVVLDLAPGELSAVVGADILDGVELALDVEHGDVDVVHVDHPEITRFQFVLVGDVEPVGHEVSSCVRFQHNVAAAGFGGFPFLPLPVPLPEGEGVQSISSTASPSGAWRPRTSSPGPRAGRRPAPRRTARRRGCTRRCSARRRR